MRSYQFRTEEERHFELKKTLSDAIIQGDNVSKIIEIIAISPDFYREKFALDWGKVKNNAALVDYFSKRDRFDKNNPPPTIDVSFAYFMIKNNQSVLLQRIIHDADNEHRSYIKPQITIPYRFVSLKEKNEDGQEVTRKAIQYLPKYDGTPESEGARQTLDVREGTMRYFYYTNLPSYIALLSRSQILDQLRSYYLKDQAVLEFAKKLKDNRYIDLLNGSSTLEPVKKQEFDDTKNIYGFGVVLTDSEGWERMLAERKRFEQTRPEYVNPKSSN